MFNYETLWDVYEMKFLIIFITFALAVWIGSYLHKKSKKND